MGETRWRHLLTTAALVFLALGSTGCGEDSEGESPDPCSQPEDITSAHWVDCRLREMTLEEKVGQLFMTYAYGRQAVDLTPKAVESNRKDHGLDTAEQLLERYHLGGIIYFAWSDNLQNPAQIAALSNSLQQVAMRQERPIPLLIATDQEHGVVARVTEPATQFPGNMALGATRSADDARRAGHITAMELRAMGINQNFGPVVDVNSNPLNPVIGVRSFGVEPELVSTLARAQLEGMQTQGIASTVKHFPGHGDTDVDSHYGLPIIARNRQQLDAVDLPPFVAAIQAGVDTIMTAHIVVPALDGSGLPATLSRPIMTELLRGHLGYNGVVVSDALTMQGAKPYGEASDARVPVEALKAGVDMLLMPPKIEVAYNAVLEAVRGGEISQERLDESVTRVLALKQRRGLLAAPFVDPAGLTVVGAAEHLNTAADITERSITLVRNEAQVLPLRAEVRRVLVTGWGPQPTQALATALTERGLTVQALETGNSPTQAKIDEAAAAAAEADVTVVLTMRAGLSQAQQRLVTALQASQKPVVVVAVREPYDVAYLSNVSTYVVTYSFRPVSMQALAKVLVGVRNPAGRLPVAIPAVGQPGTILHPVGHGLNYEG